MSNASSDEVSIKTSKQVPWNPWTGTFLAVFLFIVAQIVAGIIVSLYPLIAGWSDKQANNWLDNALSAKIAYFGLTAFFLLIPIWLFLKLHKASWVTIGLRRPKWSDPVYSLIALPVYMFFFILTTIVVKAFVPNLNLEQTQDLGFNATYHGSELAIIFIALVILPPIIEEITFRGLMYGSLKKGMPILTAAIITSLLFAGGHLLESGDNSLLYIAGIDTFILSLVLIYLREKTNGLWAPMGLHALKNGIAFVTLFLLNVR